MVKLVFLNMEPSARLRFPAATIDTPVTRCFSPYTHQAL